MILVGHHVYPGEPHTANGPRQHVRQNAGERIACREVSVEPRVLPVGHPHHDLVLHVLHDVLPWLGVMWRRRRDQFTQIARFNGWSNSAVLYLLNIRVYG